MRTGNSLRFLSCESAPYRMLCLSLLAVLSLVLGVVVGCFASSAETQVVLSQWASARRILFCAVCFFSLGCFYVFRREIAGHPEKLVLSILIAVTGFFSWAVSVGHVSWDVDSHFGFMLEWGKPIPGSTVTAAEAEVLQVFPSWGGAGSTFLEDMELKEDYLNRLDALDTGTDVDHEVSNLHKRIASLPGSLVYYLLGLGGVPFVTRYFLGHFVYAIIYSLAVYFGMKRLESGKMLYAVVAMFPTSVFLASNYSYDYWVNCFSMLGFAYLIGELQRPYEKTTLKNAAIMLASLAIAFFPKAIYFLLLLPCLLLGKGKFGTRKECYWYRFAVVSCLLLLLASFVLPMLIGSADMSDARGGSDVNSAEQIRFILSNPVQYLAILKDFLIGYLSFEGTRSFVGFFAYLGYTPWPTWLVSMVLLVFASLTDTRIEGTKKRSLGLFVVVGACALASICLVATSLYVSFTVVASNAIAGCQPRYLLPLVFPFMAFFGFVCGRRKGVVNAARYNGLITGASSASLLYSIWATYIVFLV